MSMLTGRLSKLELTLVPPPVPLHVIHHIIDPQAVGDRIIEAIACHDDRRPVHFPRIPGEAKDQLNERVERSMGWASAYTTQAEASTS